MDVADWIRATLVRSDDWRGELARLRTEVAGERAGTQRLARTVELADATDAIEPDRSIALKLYLTAWREGDLGMRARVLELARELRAHVTLAEVAVADHGETQDPDRLIAAGRAYLDAGLPERAAETFAFARRQHASLDATIAASPRLADVRATLALSKFEKVDIASETDSAVSRASRATGDAAAPAHLLALRLARLGKLDRAPALLRTAVRACPRDEELGRMYDDALLDSGTADDFLLQHRARLERVSGEEAWVECVRTAAIDLVVRGVHPGLGLRMLKTSVEHAYAEKVPMRRHIAAWELLLADARTSKSTLALAPLLADGLRAPMPTLDAIYIARAGLDIAWREAGDILAAQPYVAVLLDTVPGHPLAAQFLDETFAEPPPLIDIPPDEPEPVLPTVTFRIPTIPTAPVVTPAVPRARTISSAHLKRDASPIPAPPPPRPDAIDRPPRKVVPVDVHVELPNGSFFSAVLRDLSTTGAFVTTKRAIEIGSVITLEIRLPGTVMKKLLPPTERTIRCDAKIVRRTDVGCGLQFVDPPKELVAGITALVG